MKRTFLCFSLFLKGSVQRCMNSSFCALDFDRHDNLGFYGMDNTVTYRFTYANTIV